MPRRLPRRETIFVALLASLAGGPVACDSDKASTDESKPASASADQPKDEAAKPEAPSSKPEAPQVADEALKSAPEACAKIIVVAHAEAEGVDEASGITRDAAAAKAKAEKLRAQVEGGADFVEVAQRESDEERSKKKRAGAGTFARDAWPERYAGVDAALWQVPLEGLTPVVETPLGFAFAKRCAVDKVHTRHILVRYAGAERASEETTRSKAEAKARAEEAHAKIAAGADFAEVAAEYGEDGTAQKGGDLGPIGRGMFVTAYEDVAWGLAPGELAPVTEGPFGFHVIRREK